MPIVTCLHILRANLPYTLTPSCVLLMRDCESHGPTVTRILNQSINQSGRSSIGDDLDTPARQALLKEAGGDVQAALDNHFNHPDLGQQAPTWEPTVGGACEARFRGGRCPTRCVG